MPFTPYKLVAAGILMQIPIAMVLLSPSSPRSGPALPNMPSGARHSLLSDAQHRKHVLLFCTMDSIDGIVRATRKRRTR